MAWTNEAPLDVAVDRLDWALGKAARHYFQRDTIFPLIRALSSVEQALRVHAAAADSPSGAFTQLIDPTILPFSPLAQHVGELRAEHVALHRRAAGLRRQLESAIRSVPDHSGPPDAAEAALRQHVDALCRSARPLLVDIKRHRDTEAELILGSNG